jgi:hypothetical protein
MAVWGSHAMLALSRRSQIIESACDHPVKVDTNLIHPDLLQTYIANKQVSLFDSS